MAEREFSGHADYKNRIKASGRRIDTALSRLEQLVDTLVLKQPGGPDEDAVALAEQTETLLKKHQALQKLASELGLEVDEAIAEVKAVLNS